MPAYPRPHDLPDLSTYEFLKVFQSAFGLTRHELSVWEDDLEFVRQVVPSPNWYFYWHFKRFQDTLYRFVLPNAPEAGRILDLATYPYFWLLLRRHYLGEIICTDLHPESSSFSVPASGTINYQPIRLDITEDSDGLGIEEFDLCIFAEVIEHLRFHPFNVIVSINRALKRGGKLLLTTPNVSCWKKIWLLMGGNHPYDSATFGGAWGHSREYSPYELKQLLEKCGFELRKFESHDVYLNDLVHGSSRMMKWYVISGLAAMLRMRDAGRLVLRAGSTSFVLAEKVGPPLGSKADLCF